MIRRYLLVPSPSMEETRAAAAELGLARTRFRMLARAFADGPRPALPPGRHHARVGRDVDEQIDAAIRRLGTDVLQEDLHAVVAAACRRGGLDAPSFATVRRRLLDVTTAGAPLAAASGEIVLDRVALGVVVEVGAARVRPFLVAAVDAASGDVHGHDVDAGCAAEVQGARALVAAGAVPTPRAAIGLASDPAAWAAVDARLLATRAGRRVGRVRILAPNEAERPPGGGDVAVEMDDLRAMAADALADLGPAKTGRGPT